MRLSTGIVVPGLVLLVSCAVTNPASQDYNVTACAAISDVVVTNAGADNFTIKSTDSVPAAIKFLLPIAIMMEKLMNTLQS